MKESLNIFYTDGDGKIHSFSEVLHLFDLYVEEYGETSMIYSPVNKNITFYRSPDSFIKFFEVEE